MSSIAISSIVFAVVIGGASLGLFLHKLLPQQHLSDDSKSIVMIAMGLVATMTAIVLGLLISSAKSSFDVLSREMTGTSSDIILLDRTLALYGTETKEARDLLRSAVANGLDLMMKQNVDPAHLAVSTRDTDSIFEKIQGLLPKDDRQRSLKAEASSILFISFGLYAPTNGTVVASLLISALSVSCAIFLILELYTPYRGLIKISSATLNAALAQLGN